MYSRKSTGCDTISIKLLNLFLFYTVGTGACVRACVRACVCVCVCTLCVQKCFSYHIQPDPPTSLLCFILFTGYLSNRGSNISCLCFKIISHQAPIDLSELLHLYAPSRQLRSSTDTRMFRIPSLIIIKIIHAFSIALFPAERAQRACSHTCT